MLLKKEESWLVVEVAVVPPHVVARTVGGIAVTEDEHELSARGSEYP
jgi:hypothetical protein